MDSALVELEEASSPAVAVVIVEVEPESSVDIEVESSVEVAFTVDVDVDVGLPAEVEFSVKVDVPSKKDVNTPAGAVVDEEPPSFGSSNRGQPERTAHGNSNKV